MRLLVIAPEIPATTNMPGSPRLFNLCKALSSRHQLSLVTFASSAERYRWFMSDVTTRDVFHQILVLPPPPAATWWGTQKHRLHPLGAYFATQYRWPGYHHDVRGRIADLRNHDASDLVYVDGLATAQYVDTKTAGLAVIDLHDSGTLLLARARAAETNWWRKLMLHLESKRVAAWERSLGRSFPLIIVNSDVDEAFLRTLDPHANTLTVSNGVDSDFFSPPAIGVEVPDRLVFSGVMAYGPNEDAALYFCDAIFPLIRQQRPRAEFWVVGDSPSSKIRSLAKDPGVHVTGGVGDVRPCVHAASVFVSPLRYGSGVKNKVLAALAMQKPVVATTISVEGLALQDKRDLFVADTPAEFAAAVVFLLSNRRVADTLGENGRRLVRDKYSWQARAQSLEDALLTLLRVNGVPPEASLDRRGLG